MPFDVLLQIPDPLNDYMNFIGAGDNNISIIDAADWTAGTFAHPVVVCKWSIDRSRDRASVRMKCVFNQ